jgi:uncharacterized membrane protein YqjE
MPDSPDNPPPGVTASAKRFVRTLVATVHNRIELLVVELQEEGIRFVSVLLLAGAIGIFSLLTLVMLTFTVLFAVGEEHRLAAALIITGVYLLGAAGAAWALVVRLKNWSAFSATRAELRKDRTWLQGDHSDT